MLLNKKRHFDIETASTRRDTSLDWMRVNAERDRISKFKNVVQVSASNYYDLLESYQKLLLEHKTQSAQRVDELMAQGIEIDCVMLMEQALRDKDLLQTLRFIADFMRQVIENGNVFSKNHLFLMLLHLTPKEIDNAGSAIVEPLVRLLEVSSVEYEQFVKGLARDPI